MTSIRKFIHIRASRKTHTISQKHTVCLNINPGLNIFNSSPSDAEITPHLSINKERNTEDFRKLKICIEKTCCIALYFMAIHDSWVECRLILTHLCLPKYLIEIYIYCCSQASETLTVPLIQRGVQNRACTLRGGGGMNVKFTYFSQYIVRSQSFKKP